MTTKTDYDYSLNIHTEEGPRAALPLIFAGGCPRSLLDVGCGTGTWIQAAMKLGVDDVFGVDGSDLEESGLLFPKALFKKQDFGVSWNLGRKFEAVLCLEVAEHLPEAYAKTLIGTLVAHSDYIIFSAACPGQPGQHHVNCQWPIYWQSLFNSLGFVCHDALRWKIWDNEQIEPWYRQNLFVARRDEATAGREPRLHSVVHPRQYLPSLAGPSLDMATMRRVEDGGMPIAWYVKTGGRVLLRKALAKLRR